MKLAPTLENLLLSGALLFSSACATTGALRPIGGSDDNEQLIGKPEAVERYAMGHLHLRIWDILDPAGVHVGVYAAGPSYGIWSAEVTTEVRFLDGNPTDGPHLPEGFTAKEREPTLKK